MSATAGQLKDARQAAVALYALPREIAGRVADKLGSDVLTTLAGSLVDNSYISRSEAESALGELFVRYSDEDSIADCTRDEVEGWLGSIAKDRHDELVNGIVTSEQSPFDSVTPAELAELLSVEHPMLSVVVLEGLDPAIASQTLMELPESHRHAAALRLVYRIPVSGDYLDVLNRAFESYLSERKKRKIRALGGPAVLGGILRKVPRTVRDQITNRILELDPNRSEDLDRALLEIEDLLLLSPREMATFLQQVDRTALVVALSMVSASVKNAVLGSMGKRAAQMLEEDMESTARRPVAEIEQAQRDLMRTMWTLVDDGQITLVEA